MMMPTFISAHVHAPLTRPTASASGNDGGGRQDHKEEEGNEKQGGRLTPIARLASIVGMSTAKRSKNSNEFLTMERTDADESRYAGNGLPSLLFFFDDSNNTWWQQQERLL